MTEINVLVDETLIRDKPPACFYGVAFDFEGLGCNRLEILDMERVGTLPGFDTFSTAIGKIRVFGP